uniref:Small integral membrane protein 14 n=1 Tax=Panagrellus redivivus TaxID=6233 RepID=A0A7E4VUA3_PANRE
MDLHHSYQSYDYPNFIRAMDRLCECLLDPTTIIRTVLRTLQGEASTSVTDNGFNDLELPAPFNVASVLSMFFVFMSFVTIMFATRPASLRRSDTNGTDKPRYTDNHPPTPPPSVG